MLKHYAYTIDHDTGYAPNVDYGICTLCGCKRRSIEPHASKDSLVFGFGGNQTGWPGLLIYAMCVDASLTIREFRSRYPGKSRYLGRGGPHLRASAPVLLSRRYFYFGDRAFELPKKLRYLVFRGRGCKLVPETDASRLWQHIRKRAGAFGRHGWPCNGDFRGRRPRCSQGVEG
jgi:hypothetical protein